MPGCYPLAGRVESAASMPSRYDARMASALSNRDLLTKLVSFDTTSSNPNAPLADFICEYVERPGVRIERDEHEGGAKVNLLVMAGPEPDASRQGLLLSGHLDGPSLTPRARGCCSRGISMSCPRPSPSGRRTPLA